MIDPTTILPADTAARVAAWLLTYALHGTVLLGIAAAAMLGGRLHESVRETIWKAALLGALVTASLATWRPGPGALTVTLSRTESPAAAVARAAAPFATTAARPPTVDDVLRAVQEPRGTEAQWLVALWLAGAA